MLEALLALLLVLIVIAVCAVVLDRIELLRRDVRHLEGRIGQVDQAGADPGSAPAREAPGRDHRAGPGRGGQPELT